jgi:hypothetical protein
LHLIEKRKKKQYLIGLFQTGRLNPPIETFEIFGYWFGSLRYWKNLNVS